MGLDCAEDKSGSFRAPSVQNGPRLSEYDWAQLSEAFAVGACPELGCLRGRMPARVLDAAARRAQAIGADADRVLSAAGLLDEESYVRALANALGLPFERLDHRRRSECPLADDLLIDSVRTGVLPIRAADEVRIAIAPGIAGSRALTEAAASNSELGRRLSLTTSQRLSRFVASRAATRIGTRAAYALPQMRPDLSAAPRTGMTVHAATGAVVGVLAAIAAPKLIVGIVEAALAAVFLAWTALRAVSLLSPALRPSVQTAGPENSLPVYTLIVALYREAAAVPGLMAALERLNYPREKLDLKFALEADDADTIAALAAFRGRLPFEIVIAPQAGPRTKPKALNAALLFARGKFVAIYDAEDRPEPDQLRLALEAFIQGDERLACVQARLTIDNMRDGWLTRSFTAEYAGLFDVLLPGMASWRLPLPLGGSSNHFRTQILRDVGGWDAFNVTEDADLGMRLARFGYGATVIASTTYEEAPRALGPWLCQRTRWFKGWIQTWLVHMRTPLRLLCDLGPAGFVAFQLVVGGTVLAALVHGLFALWFAAGLVSGRSVDLFSVHFVVLAAGYVVSGLLGLVGLMRRGLLGSAWVLLLIPLYWVLLSAAAWRALWQVLFDPYRWEKTEHGLAKTSRLADAQMRSSPMRGAPGRVIAPTSDAHR